MKIKPMPDQLIWLNNAVCKNKIGLILSVCGGILLEIPNILWMFEPYISFSSKLREDEEMYILLAISVLFAVLIPIVSIAYKCKSLQEVLCRTAIMFLSEFITTMILADTGFYLKAYDMLQIATYDPTDNAIGLMLALYLILIIFTSFAIIVSNTIVRFLVKRFKSKTDVL